MTITIDLTPETEAKLKDKAAALGQDLPAYLRDLAERDAAEDADALHEGILRGLVAEAQGRYRPAADVFADLEARHGLPAA